MTLQHARSGVPVLAGPTASGKTALSLDLAAHYPIEVISADAMMVYRGMNIGTAKPTLLERARVPHHGIDLVDPDTDFSVVEWVHLAEDAIRDVLARGRVPLVVGGTGFYIRALKRGLPTTPPSDPVAIAKLERELAEVGLDKMVSELERASPADASRAARNPRRVLRALEILRASGFPPKDFPALPPQFAYRTVLLMPPKPVLDARIELRTRTMLADGLIEETRGLMTYFIRADADGQARRSTSFQAIGYKQALDHLMGEPADGGAHRNLGLEELEHMITLATRQYAKRQLTWFKREPEAIAVDTPEAARLELVRILERWAQPSLG